MPLIDNVKISKKSGNKKSQTAWNLLDDNAEVLSDVAKKTENPSTTNRSTFVKKEYRPWDLMDNEARLIGNHLVTTSNLISDQIDNILEPIGNQSVTIRDTVSNHNSNQLEIKNEPIIDQKVSNNEPISNRISNQYPTSLGKQLVTQLVTRNLTNETPLNAIQLLFGLQKKIFFYIVESCVARGVLESGPITNETLQMLLNTDADTVKTAVHRLVKKGLVNRFAGKRGKGGFSIFSITESIRNAAMEEQRKLNIGNHLVTQLVTTNGNQLVTNRESNKEPMTPISSSNIYMNNTITIENQLPSEWRAINIIPLSDLGFNEKHLFDIYKTNASTPEIVQESINHFAYGLEHNSEKYNGYPDPLNVFVGRLRKGHHWNEANYVSPQELAQRKILERKKAERERLAKLQEEVYEIALSEWKEKLSADEIEIIAPKKGGVGPQDIRLSIYFRENVWSSVKSEYLIS